MPSVLLPLLRTEFKRAAIPAKAPGMQAYMKSTMPYWGVPMPAMRRICKQIFRDNTLPSAAAWRKEVLALWREAKYREERYAAIELSGQKQYAAYQTLDVLPLYEELIVTGAWWDFVDTLASNRVGPLLERFPKEMRAEMLAWSRSDNLWKRRSAIISQLTFKERTDLKLLYATIEPALHETEFFLRKAIGWALRQYAWTDPDEVMRYVESNKDRLSGLSKREALKNID